MALGRNVLKKESASQVVFEYQAKAFPIVAAAPANDFISTQNTVPTDFKIDPLIAQQSGVARLQKDALNDRIEEEAFAQLKVIEEKAYKEGFALGQDEGREEAFRVEHARVEAQLNQFDQILQEIENLKKKILKDHEVHIIATVFSLASKVALKNIETESGAVLPVIEQVLMESQDDEKLTLHVAEADYQFIQQLRERTNKLGESLKRVSIEVDQDIRAGGCRMESNYGTIDATIETRVTRAWNAIYERLPQADQRTEPKVDDGN